MKYAHPPMNPTPKPHDPRIAALAAALEVVLLRWNRDCEGPEGWRRFSGDYAAAILAALPPSFFAVGCPLDIEWEDVVDGLEVALSAPAEMEVNRERWRAARIAILDAWDREPKP